MFKDQIGNINALVRAGAAEMMQYQEITADIVSDRINKILQNDRCVLSFKCRMRENKLFFTVKSGGLLIAQLNYSNRLFIIH